MAGAHINFTDGIGSAQLDNGMTAVAGGYGSQFVGWMSESKPVGPIKAALGTGAAAAFIFRTDYLATFELQEIPNANVAILDRLMAWLSAGGTVSVTCGDSTSAVYATCCLAESTKPAKRMFDKQSITWALKLTLVNIAVSPVPMTCIYNS
jgi:hypothetical protein